MQPLPFRVRIKNFTILFAAFAFFVIYAQVTWSQIIANDDFYVIDEPQFTEPSLNDFNHGGTQMIRVQNAQHANISINNWDPYSCTRCPYVLPHGNYTGYDFFTYQYVVCCGNPPGPPSNIATVHLMLIGNSDLQNAGACPMNRRTPSSFKGEPVNVTNGNMWLEQTDYHLPGLGEIIEINRFYNSMIQTSGLFGHGWSTKYDESLSFYFQGTIRNEKSLRLNLPDGKAVYFGRTNTTSPFVAFSPDVDGQIVLNVDTTYTLTYKNGSSRRFNSSGRLLSASDRNGNQTTLTYDIYGRLIGITDSVGRALTITPNANGTIAQISDSHGMAATYEYFPDTTRLKTVTYPDGSKYKFEYTPIPINGKMYLTTVKDALDNILETHQYDTQGRAATSEKQGGVEKYTFNYTRDVLNEPITIVTDALGHTTTYRYFRKYGINLIKTIEGACSCGGSGTELTQYFYDDRHNLTKEIDALGRQTTYAYDGNRNLLTETDVLGTQKWTYNSFGQVLTYKDRIDSQNTDPNVNTQVNTYDANGNLKTVTNALGKTTTIDYPTVNNKGLPDSIKDARNNITKFKWFANSGLLEEIEDPYTKKTKFTYDARGRIKMVANALDHLTQYNYFDDTQRKVEMIYPNLDKITYKYDIRRTLESVTDERGKITNYEFDPQYRLKKITDPLGHFREFGYDLMSNMATYKDPLGNITDYKYDDFNRLKEIEYPAAMTGATRLKERLESRPHQEIFRHGKPSDRILLQRRDANEHCYKRRT